MQRSARFGYIALVAAGLALGLVACGGSAVTAPKEEAVVVEAIDGSELKRLTLSEKAFARLGIATAPVGQDTGGASMTVIPYSAVIYAKDGTAWTYTNPAGRSFVRHELAVDRIAADQAFLTLGPPIGTMVVTVGVAELWGVETGVGGGH